MIEKKKAESNQINEHTHFYRIDHSLLVNYCEEKKISIKSIQKKYSEKKSFRWHVEHNLLKKYSPAAVLVDDSGKIVYCYGDTGKFMELPTGYVDSFNIKRMARPELRKEIRKILYESFLSKKNAMVYGVQFNVFGVQTTVDLTAIPVNIKFGKKGSYYLVTFGLPFNGSESSNDSCFDTKYAINLEKKKAEFLYFNRGLEEVSASLRNKKKELSLVEELLDQAQAEHKKNQELLNNSTNQLISVRKEITVFESKMDETKYFPQNLKMEILEIRKELFEIKREFCSTEEEIDLVNLKLQSKVQKLKDLDAELIDKLYKLDEIKEELANFQKKLTVARSDYNRKIIQVSQILDIGQIYGTIGQVYPSIFFDSKTEAESDYFCFDKDSTYLNQDFNEISYEIPVHAANAVLVSSELDNSTEKKELNLEINDKPSSAYPDLKKLTDRKFSKIPQNKIFAFNSSKSLNEVMRQERKFLLNMNDFYRHSDYLEKILSQDIHNGSTGYMIRSLYFDTLDDRDFHEKENGIELRRKIRLRNYDPNSEFAMLEIKQKQGANQLKRSLKVNREDASELMNGDYRCLLRYAEPFAAECYGIMNMHCYRPKTIVQYDRKAFIAKENKIRVTLDSNITATESCFDIFSNELALNPVLDQFNFVMEVKYNGFLLSYIRELINEVNGSEISVSKYCLARNISCNYNF